MTTTTTIHVRDGHEYGTFFVEESDVFERSDGKIQASATWTAQTSYGTYGHHWSSMGCPFPKFVQGVQEDYLLGKIATKRSSPALAVKFVLNQISDMLKAKEISEETAEACRDAVADAEDEPGDVCIHELYMSTELNDAGVCFDDMPTEDYDGDSKQFVKRLWPKFVEAMQERLLEAARLDAVARVGE